MLHTHIHPLLAVWGLTTTSWLVLWSVLAVLTIVILILLRTRWSNARPWRKCAILSLWVHILLAFAATTVRIMGGAPDLGNDEPIRVAVVPAVLENEEILEEEITPDWEMSTELPLVAPELEALEPPELEPLEAPDLEPLPSESPEETPLPEPATEEPAQQISEPSPTPSESVTEENAPTEEPPTEPEEIAQEPAPEPVPSPELPTPPESEQQVDETYSDRFAEDRSEIVEQRGGSQQTEKAVRSALGWLAQAQSDTGGWDASKFEAGQERFVLGENRNRAGVNADTGISGLALLAFLGQGHTHRGGPYAQEVARGLEYLRQTQRSDGSLYGDAQVFARTYCHSMATFAVCEALALSKDKRLRPMAQAAIRYTLSLQHPSDGGWRYLRGHTGDTSQLGWVMMTLKSAELAGLEIPQVTWNRADRFLRRVERGSAGGLASYRPDGPPSRTMTAEAMFCRLLRTAQRREQLNLTVADEATRSILQELPNTRRKNLYYWYYASLALHQNQNQSEAASEAWEDWNHALTTTLLTTQTEDGSWDTSTTWGGYGGRVYTTALSALCLEVYYRYNPSDAPGELADRNRWKSVR